MKKADAKSTEPKKQYAALPFRRRDELEVLLVSSRGTRRWVIPKGWPKKGCKPHVTAAREAQEEAGVIGEIGRKSLGFYSYFKEGEKLLCLVEVFPLEVRRQRKTWPEKNERTTKWFPLDLAAEAVTEPGLKEVIRNFRDPAQPAAAAGSGIAADRAVASLQPESFR
ncbi:MAG TPA: NUDIX hydrolase [Beijerinckiaceae bacterium]|nr:NUDIX hydrolase [Beijerinckiaceae bacterium]